MVDIDLSEQKWIRWNGEILVLILLACILYIICGVIGFLKIYFIKYICVCTLCTNILLVTVDQTVRNGKANSKHNSQWMFNGNVVLRLLNHIWRWKAINSNILSVFL
jgi:hypothetical protein